MRNLQQNFLAAAILVVACGSGGMNQQIAAQARKPQPAVILPDKMAQQPLYSEYRGVHLGMTAAEVQAKLGPTELKASDLDYYVISDSERAQIVYKDGKVVTISV